VRFYAEQRLEVGVRAKLGGLGLSDKFLISEESRMNLLGDILMVWYIYQAGGLKHKY